MTRLLFLSALVLTLLVALVETPNAGAEASARSVILAIAGAGEAGHFGESPLAPVPLILDDGVYDESIGRVTGGQMLWLNRFTPPAASFPFTLHRIELYVSSESTCAVGDAVEIYVYSDNDGNPANGATHLGSLAGRTIQTLDGWSVYLTNITLATPGDVLIGVVNRGCTLVEQFPAALDWTASQGRSWAGWDADPIDHPPVLPIAFFRAMDSIGFPGNWMIRGLGETCSGPCAPPLPTPSVTPTATPAPLPPGTYCASPAVRIPDYNPTGVTSTISVPASGPVTDVTVLIDATHTRVGDLSFTVTHGATSARLIDRPGSPATTVGCLGANIDANLNDDASLAVEDQCEPSVPTIDGTFQPNDPLSVFDGIAMGGTWTITATDASPMELGRLRQWCLIFNATGETPTLYLPLVVR